jgi:hypothetical protein
MRKPLLATLAFGLLCACWAAPGSAQRPLIVGAAEDAPKQPELLVAKAKMDLARLAGLSAVRITSVWAPGQTTVSSEELLVLRNAAAAALLDGIRLFVSVYPRDPTGVPLTTAARREFAAYAASVARALPTATDFIVGNEPNLNGFWMPQFTAGGQDAAAPAYERLLADSYDALKAVNPGITVIGGALAPRGGDRPLARPTHSPTIFIRDLGRTYRASKRKRPIMDMLAFHPYLEKSQLPPTFSHPRNKYISLNDHGKLTALLSEAFDGTAQRGTTLPILYDEFGVQSQIVPAKAELYTNADSPGAQDAVPETTQAAYYRQALELATCQPTVVGLLFFHVSDESDLRAWQSGLFYVDDTPKSSMAQVSDAARAAEADTLVPLCSLPVSQAARR